MINEYLNTHEIYHEYRHIQIVCIILNKEVRI